MCIRNEGAFLLDWIAHHRACGVTDFVIASNNCQDGSDAMLRRLDRLGIVTHVENEPPYGQRGIQFTALRKAARTRAVQQAEWLITLDIDEFINIHVGDRSIGALLSHLAARDPGRSEGAVDAVAMTWRLFGNGGAIRYVDTPVSGQFTRAAPLTLAWPWRASLFKTLYRNNGLYRKLGVHRPRAPDPARVTKARWVDGAGRPLPGAFRTGRVFTPPGSAPYDLVQLNHYPLGAMESFLLKADRGRAVHQADRIGMDYWVERNWCCDDDHSISALAPAVARQRATLASDPELARRHQAAVDWRHTRLAQLLEDEPWQALFARLLITPPSSALPARLSAELTARALQARSQSATLAAQS
ncbi:glycosyltransferase family 2 protein [Cognatishimia sp. F0-27]|uniref:glycosyltransferase family 2 protein n=1 Tax=Cognatishimia sp. F0-27 TaxID=2816855 RepID=UPI001D0C8E10|nr:glycosyltransferase family 2 protein [Cognatishimia sp. F0-27]MCC1493449.1 glycosyltransferase family 2 protein [Cognatishimia sp. F0-27]